MPKLQDWLVGLYHYCAEWHDGQWSREYRLMCLADTYHHRWFGFHLSLDVGMTEPQHTVYSGLVEKYQEPEDV